MRAEDVPITLICQNFFVFTYEFLSRTERRNLQRRFQANCIGLFWKRVWIRDILIEFTERFFSGYARSSSLNFFVKNKSVKKILLVVLRKTHAIHKKNRQHCRGQHNKSKRRCFWCLCFDLRETHIRAKLFYRAAESLRRREKQNQLLHFKQSLNNEGMWTLLFSQNPSKYARKRTVKSSSKTWHYTGCNCTGDSVSLLRTSLTSKRSCLSLPWINEINTTEERI